MRPDSDRIMAFFAVASPFVPRGLAPLIAFLFGASPCRAVPPSQSRAGDISFKPSGKMEAATLMTSTRLFSVLCLLAAVAPAPAVLAAAGPSQVVLSVDVKEEISAPDAQGNIRIVRREVDRADPGDVLVYTLTYTNLGTTPAANARVDDPIPAGTLLLPASVEAGKARVTFSADGGKSFAAGPLTKTIDGPDGKPVTVELPAESYTHIRWTAPDTLAAGESRTGSFKVVVR